MKKDNTLLWVAFGSILVVGTIVFIMTRPKKDKKAQPNMGEREEDVVVDGSKVVINNQKIDLSKFKIDVDKITSILNNPVPKQRQYELLEQSGVPQQTISLVKKADEAQKQKNLSDSIKRIQQKQRDAEFEKLTGIKPRPFSYSVSVGGM